MRDTSTDVFNTSTTTHVGLSARGLAYHSENKPLIYDLTLTLPDTGIHCIMGPNGAGKSLSLRLLHGLLAPIAGDVTWHGMPFSAADRAAQAMVFQKPVLLRRSVAANVDFVLRARRTSDKAFRDALLERVGLSDHAATPARSLSGGEQQRLAMARALALRPRILFLDEPTASLDPTSAILIEDILNEERQRGTLCLLVTHDIAQARRLADSVTFLSQGRVCEQATADEFFHTPSSPQARSYLNGQLVL